jgi:hypothetical protein
MTQYRTWDQLTEVEQLQNIYSDDYKDVHGLRPRPPMEQWRDVEWLRAEVDSLREQIEGEML